MALVLIVEDNADLREMYQEILAMEGHTVFLAENAPEALPFLEREQPDVVVLDLGVVGGVNELVASLRGGGKEPGLILASGSRDLDQWAARLSADAYLEKPFSHDRLVDAVNAVSAKKAKR